MYKYMQIYGYLGEILMYEENEQCKYVLSSHFPVNFFRLIKGLINVKQKNSISKWILVLQNYIAAH